MKPKLIVFEGVDGVGKTTLSQMLVRAIRKRGLSAVRYEDIEDKAGGFNQLKPFIKKGVSPNASLLFYVASSIHKSEIIDRLLKSKWVICDRYVYSTLAAHAVKKADMNLLPPLGKMPIRKPDHAFLVCVDENIRQNRVRRRRSSTPQDLKRKTAGSRAAKMERELGKYVPTVLDNSSSDLDATIEQVLKKIGL